MKNIPYILSIVFFSIALCYSCQDAPNSTEEAKAIPVVEETKKEEKELTEEEKKKKAERAAKAKAKEEAKVLALKLYDQHCTTCHEESIEEFAVRDWKNGNSWNEVFHSIKKGHTGVKNAGSLATTLSDDDISKLTDHILYGLESSTIESFEVDPDWTGTIRSEVQTFRLDTISRGFEIPWGLAYLPNGDILITDRNGNMYRQAKGGAQTAIKGVPTVKYKGQGGLLDVIAHPDFAKNSTIYLAYSKLKGDKESTTAVMMTKLVNDELVDQKEILEALPYVNARNHYGSRIVFDGKGHLFITVGDRTKRDDYPQDLSKFQGKVHRLNMDGSIPKDNPFVNTPNAVPSVWSYGHRNPQGLVYDTSTGRLWESEHAPRGGDEINTIKKGANYGWPLVSYGINYSGSVFTKLTEKKGMEQPTHHYMPSPGTCGLTIVRSDKYPNWEGNLMAGSLRFRYLSRLVVENNTVVAEERLLENIGRVRSVIMGGDGYLYIGVENPGYVFRLMPISG